MGGDLGPRPWHTMPVGSSSAQAVVQPENGAHLRCQQTNLKSKAGCKRPKMLHQISSSEQIRNIIIIYSHHSRLPPPPSIATAATSAGDATRAAPWHCYPWHPATRRSAFVLAGERLWLRQSGRKCRCSVLPLLLPMVNDCLCHADRYGAVDPR